MDQGEKLKFNKYYEEFRTFKLDITYTTNILQSLADDNPWNKKNYDRLLGF